MSYEPYDLFVFAGEKSGDLHGEKLLQALKAKNPQLKIAGVGGPKMRAQGMHCVLPMEKFQVMGFIDVFLALPKLLRYFYFVVKKIRHFNPKAVITIDYPGFNLRLTKHLKKTGYTGKCIHFICPSVWAWGKKRIPLMAKTLDLLLSILPFEKALFANTPLKVAYVGHPLVERIKTHSYKPLFFPNNRRVVAIFPGSRTKEIERNLPLFLDVCHSLLSEHPELHFAISISDERFSPLIHQILNDSGWKEGLDLSLIRPEYSYELMKASSFAIAKSGTVTLELALHRIPTVVTYGISFLDVIIARDILRIRLPYYCLVNIIAEKEVFSELFGPNFTFDRLKEKVTMLLNNDNYEAIQKKCDHVIELLGNQKTSEEAANAILQLL